MKTNTIKNTSLNPILSNLKESDTLVINEKSKQLIAEGKTVYKFGLGQSPFPVPDHVVAALRLYAKEKDYLPVRGLTALREAVAEFHRRKDHIAAQADCVMIGPGSKELLFLLQLVFGGETIVVSPCWVSYVPQATILGKKIEMIQSSYEDKWHLTPARFAEFLKQRKDPKEMALLILNYPGNPDGMSYGESDLSEIAELARANNIVILSDEIYGQLHHEGKHVSISKFYPEGTIISSGISKWCGAGGWRLGTFTFPQDLKWILDKMAVVASETYTSVCAPVQYAACEAFKASSEMEEYLSHTRKILKAIGNDCANRLNEAGIKTHAPVGGFYLFLDFSSHLVALNAAGFSTSAQICKQLLEDTGVAVLPGSSFGRADTEMTARLAYVDFDGARSLAASRLIPLHNPLPAEFNSLHCPKVINGISEITRWIKLVTKNN